MNAKAIDTRNHYEEIAFKNAGSIVSPINWNEKLMEGSHEFQVFPLGERETENVKKNGRKDMHSVWKAHLKRLHESLKHWNKKRMELKRIFSY